MVKTNKFDKEQVIKRILEQETNNLSRFDLNRMTKNELKKESFKYGRSFKSKYSQKVGA